MVVAMMAWPSLADKNKSASMPELAFLEFLAEMEAVDGNLLSPSDLLDVTSEQLTLLNPSSLSTETLPVANEPATVADGAVIPNRDKASNEATKGKKREDKS